MKNKIEVREVLRPCMIGYVKSDAKKYYKKALFHRWVPFDNLFDPFCKDKIKGLVEYEDGTMDYVWASNIRFLDPQHREYAFREVEDERRDC